MKLNPLNTLTGRMVLVTIVAVIVSYAIAFALYANERGAALRRAAETAVIERITYTAERLRNVPAARREFVADSIRDFSIRYDVSSTPGATETTGGAGQRVAAALSERLDNAVVHAHARTVDTVSRRWGRERTRGDRERERRNHERGDHAPPDAFDASEVHARHRQEMAQAAGAVVRVTELGVSVQLDANSWLNARARLPGPRPAPLGVLAGALVSIVIVGIGAALVSRQIGRPLADLATAARALGAGQANVSAPVSGPDDVRNASTAFNAMAERLGRQLNRQRQMLWALSHDLRTPITAIRLRAELLDDEAARQRLLASVEEMERLTEQALSLARAGASEEARTNVDLAEIARTLCGELQDMGLNITADAPSPIMAECRPSEIARAARNLAENAAKYGGGGVMRVYKTAANEAVIEVADNGPGVPAVQLAKLTTPFFRADESRGTTNGAGLGLAIAQAIADSHGGRLELENRVPKGFSAKLVLPS